MIITKPSRPLRGSVDLGGSKSFTNRALFMAALADGTSVIKNASLSNDSKIFISALRKLGVKITLSGTTLKVTPAQKFDKKVTINARDAGTAFRFLTALCSLTEKEVTLTGSERMKQRPAGELVCALRALGAEISCTEKEGFAPLKISKGNFTRAKVNIDGGISSQFISALLMLAPALKTGLEITVKGKLVSASYIDMTISAMRAFGAKVENKNYKTITVAGGGYKKTVYVCEPDASGASYFWALAALGAGGKIRVNNINPSSVQGDVKFADVLEKMGAEVTRGKNYIQVKSNGPLKALNADMRLMPDTIQTLAVVCAFAPGKSVIKGISTLRIKETDRVAALQAELKKMNVPSVARADELEIYGIQNPTFAAIETYSDHRMAMSFAVAAARTDGMEIKEPGVIKKSFPDFWKKLKKLGFKIK